MLSRVVASIVMTGATALAGAQAAPENPSGEPSELNEVIVTGTRIIRPGLEAPNPVQTFSAEALERSGEVNVTDFLVDIPALNQSRTNAETAGSSVFQQVQGAGVDLLDLRGLGVERTLVLVNGRRHVGGFPGTSGVDINSIPSALIERVDVLTGGVSAIYGSDGVTGVVNFVLKRNFEGIEATAQTGVTKYGDGRNRDLSLTAGTNFADSRGNVALAYQFTGSDRLSSTKRSFLNDPLKHFFVLQNFDYRPGVPGSYRTLASTDVRYAESSPDAAVDIDGDFLADFTGSGQPYDHGIDLGGYAIGGSSSPLTGYVNDVLPKFNQNNVNLLATFELSPALHLFAEGKYVRSKTFTQASANFDFAVFLAPDNAFLTERFGALPDGAYYSRDNFDLPLPFDRSTRETLRGVIGMDGLISDHLRYEVSYVNGRTTANTTKGGNRYGDRYFAALDAVIDPATGNAACRSSVFPGGDIDPVNFYDDFGNPRSATTFTPGAASGCLPLNVLGLNVADPAAVAWITAQPTIRARIEQQVISGSLSGDTGAFFSLPAGPVGYSVGAEYRKDESDSRPDQNLQSGAIFDIGPYSRDRGSYDVKEVFGELNVVLAKDLPFAHLLSIGGALRLSDYSTVGSATTWKVDTVYAPIRAVSFRGTYSKVTRAPNINELFAGESTGFAGITDPCGPDSLDLGSSYRADNCAALLGGLGFSPAEIAAFDPENLPSASTPDRLDLVGNPDLGEEKATTWTAGIVLRPAFAQGLTVSLDWYDIDLRNAISTSDGQAVTELCVDQPTLDNPFCGNVVRDTDPTSPDFGTVTGVSSRPENVASFRSRGMDLSLGYALRPGGDIGMFDFGLVAGYVDQLTTIATPGALAINAVGVQPRWVARGDVNWTRGSLDLSYGLSWQGKTDRFTHEDIAAGDIAPPDLLLYKERWEHDIQASFDATDQINVYGGVNNLTNQKPDFEGGDIPLSPLGRFFYAGVRARFH